MSRDWQPVVGAYLAALEAESKQGTLISERKLPAPRDIIKDALIEAARNTTSEQTNRRRVLEDSYARLAYFIDDEDADQAIKGEVFVDQFGGLDLMNPEQDAVLKSELSRGLAFYEKFKQCRRRAEEVSRALRREWQQRLNAENA